MYEMKNVYIKFPMTTETAASIETFAPFSQLPNVVRLLQSVSTTTVEAPLTIFYYSKRQVYYSKIYYTVPLPCGIPHVIVSFVDSKLERQTVVYYN